MPTPQLSKAESEFFSSGGTVVAESLKEGLPAAPEQPVKGNNEVPHETSVEKQPEKQAVTNESETKTPEEIAKANADATKARQKLLADLGAVPLEALQEARNEGKLTKQELASLKQRLEQVEPLLQQLKPQQAPAEQNPYDQNTQPAEYKQYQEWIETKQAAKEFKEYKQKNEQLAQANAQTQQILSWNSTQEAEFKKTNPDFDEALKFASAARDAELQATLPWLTEAERQQAVLSDRAQIIQAAALRTMQGIPTNPAELVFSYAKARGYKTAAPAPAVDKTTAALEKIAAGQAASGGLNGGAAPKGEITPQDLATRKVNPLDPESVKAWERDWKKAMRG
jgi:hypothetical protein